MAKIVKVTGTEVIISNNEEYLKINPSELNFVPKLGDEVEVHKVDDEIIIIKAEEKKMTILILTLLMKTTLHKINHKSFIHKQLLQVCIM
ncbi:hypothetical protein [Streptococcus salivarius]